MISSKSEPSSTSSESELLQPGILVADSEEQVAVRTVQLEVVSEYFVRRSESFYWRNEYINPNEIE
jgi:hypothetical protein